MIKQLLLLIIPFIFLLFSIDVSSQENTKNQYVKRILDTIHQNLTKINFDNVYNNSQEKIDSLHQALKTTNILTEKAIVYNQLASIQRDNMDSLGYYAHKANELLMPSKDMYSEEEYILSLYLLSEHARRSGFLSKALSIGYKAMEIIEKSKDKKKLFPLRSKLTRSISITHSRSGDLELSIEYYYKLLHLLQADNIHPSQISSYIYFNLAGEYLETEQIDSTITYINKGINHAIINNEENIIVESIDLLIHTLIETEMYEKAERYLEIFIRLCKNTNNEQVLPYYYEAYAYLSEELNKSDQVLKYAELAYIEACKRNNFSHKIQLGKNLAEVYTNKNLSTKAYKLLKEMDSLETSVINDKEKNRLHLEELQYRDTVLAIEKQEKKIQQQANKQKANKQKEVIILFVSALFVFAVITSIVLFRGQEKKKKLAQSLLKQKQELEKLDQIKSHFFSNISHELRTPLTLISSPIETLLDYSKKESSNSYIISNLTLIQRNAKSLKSLVNDILDLSKLESNKLELQEENVAISPLLKRISSGFDSLAKHNNIQYITSFENLPNQWVSLDIGKVEKVLNNLLSNAIKNTQTEGKVTLTASRKKDILSIEVTDTGQGISKEDLPNIFDRFFQSKQPNISTQSGTGIGLALAKELTHLMSGNITVKSELGVGSTFSVSLPFRQVSSPVAIKNFTEEVITKEEVQVNLDHLVLHNDTQIKKQHTILIVEDNHDMQQFIASLLHNQYHVFLANNGKEALEILTQQNINLIISDVMMPEMDGYTLLEKVKTNDSYRHISIIMLTALGSDTNKLKALILGVDDYLLKPFSPKELLARCHNLLEYSTERGLIENEDIQNSKITSIQADTSIDTIEPVHTIQISRSEIDWIEDVEEVIRKELENNDFLLKNLAEHFNLSKRQFQRKIKKITGLTPKKYRQEIALQKARELLENGSYENTTAIAYSIGMNHVTRFSKLYEARFGKKPSEYFYY
ncbi:response regulator [Aquimarina sp. 2201CG14-23]|uniref:response regulator n=1 Tax=Aquimarina mycalae TaxID=3040073 RepID=UPI002477EBAB|nr:response regulator [Aquimarina sp. 2201CG14-23]MDH7445856.1 response regulator [Aquimarina sp. 2201CG14-23]